MIYTYLKSIIIGLVIAIVILIVQFSIKTINTPNGYNYAISKSANSVVNISVKDNTTNELISSASGIIMSKDGYILTNLHVILNYLSSHTIAVQLRDGSIYYPKIVGTDKRTDLAVLKITSPDKEFPAIAINEKMEPRLGDVVLAIGNPHNLGQTITHGIISAIGRTGSGLTKYNTMDLSVGIQELIQTDAPINAGNSGGALINTNGEFVAINTATLTNNNENTYGISFAIPHKLALHIMNSIIKEGRVIRGYLGITAHDYQINGSIQGIIINSIDPYGPSFNALQINDIIKKINDETIENTKQAMEIIANSQPGTTVKLEIIRYNKMTELEITVCEQQQ
ncbi:MAG: trypsin-like peptidase domain-containing protein [Succinivibrionaceae bacterium]